MRLNYQPIKEQSRRQKAPGLLYGSNGKRYGVDLVGRVTCPFVNTFNSLRRRSLGEAIDDAGFRVRPCLFEINVFVTLDLQVGVVRSLELLRSDTNHVVMNVHKLRHDSPRWVRT